ncbi:Neither inactivation nor afterpotential protein C [Zootermopsis nevadensis]|uniref:non-specific serine/threonine protein kinase n=1 Tax=Zootermopsis nevadensis TaxID=136037 RepID=A0A067RAF4_ZOONE|nr:Neither inactivation nor afterpotential protein C [Zootermopsis nevadensis]
MKLSSLQDPGDRYKLGDLLGSGAYSEVFEATDQNSGGKKVAIKILTVSSDTVEDLHSEYKILRQHSGHPSLPDLYGVYLKKAESRSENDKLWFVMELCGGGPVTDLVRGVNEENRRMREEHIAYILKEIIKVLVHLYDNNVIHRDVKGSNVLLTKDGEVKLVDFGLSRSLKSNRDKLSSCLGSPCWMAPEVIVSGFTEGENAYDSRVDVWALGITAIELGDGKAPLQGLHPTRALFQILRNPPPRLYRPANWSQEYNDFIAECLEKNPEHRPYITELLEHPFITAVPENDYHLSMELKILIEDFARIGKSTRKMEVAIRNGCLKTGLSPTPEVMRLEDLAAMETLSEDSILAELHERLKQGQCHTFVGDVLLVLTPNEKQTIYTDEFHAKYQMKARSDNAPHIFSVADRAYQDMLHHEEPQYILLAGETLSGKTTNMAHLLRHLLFLGQSPNKIGDNVEKAMQIVDALSNAATPFNPNSTRHLLQLELTFTATGKVSGAVLWLYQLEKWRITTPHKGQANFHIFYYFYDAMEATDRLERYDLDAGRAYRYLRTQAADNCDENISGVREDPRGNVVKFQELEQHLLDLGFQDDQMDTVCGLIAAILNLGEVRFKLGREEEAELENPEVATKVARLLGVDEEKFLSALTNCCTIQEGTAVGQRHTPLEAEEARDALACGIYFRLVDWIINVINQKLFFTRAIFSDKYSITLMDLCGFECFGKNGLEQLFINTLNEQLQYHYNQHVFAWEMEEQEVENIPAKVLNYYDNKPTVDELMAKPDGLFHLLDEASRTNQSSDFILGLLESSGKSSNLKVLNGHEFSIAHYTGKVLYDAKDMIGKNRDFLPPEMVETLRLSSNDVVKLLFTNQLSNTGNLIMSAEDCGFITNMKNRWGTALMAGNACRARKYLTESQSQFSQTGQMRTAATTYRGTSLEVLRGAGSGSSHFVRCIRTNLTGQPGDFHHEIVRQQLRALAVVNTAQARQKGYPYRIPFPEFIRRYKFLAFNFDETVDVTMDNCRLLLVRLKLEGWVIGKSKVFLKYYNEEYLSRLYEIQVKKIIKVQALMRVFLAKRKLKFREHSDGKSVQQSSKSSSELTEEKASIIIQKQFRGYCVRKQLGSVTKRKLDVNTMKFILEYYRRWKAKTIFQVLLIYRAARQQDLVYLSQQIHLYNQSAMSGLDKCNKVSVLLERVECGAHASLVLGKQRPTVWKLPFHLQQDFPYFETTNLNDPVTSG